METNVLVMRSLQSVIWENASPTANTKRSVDTTCHPVMEAGRSLLLKGGSSPPPKSRLEICSSSQDHTGLPGTTEMTVRTAGKQAL